MLGWSVAASCSVSLMAAKSAASLCRPGVQQSRASPCLPWLRRWLAWSFLSPSARATLICLMDLMHGWPASWEGCYIPKKCPVGPGSLGGSSAMESPGRFVSNTGAGGPLDDRATWQHLVVPNGWRWAFLAEGPCMSLMSLHLSCSSKQGLGSRQALMALGDSAVAWGRQSWSATAPGIAQMA